MPCRISLARWMILAALLFVGTAPQAQSSTALESIANGRPEVRLRKLHLVRPDLIPYPLYLEVCC